MIPIRNASHPLCSSLDLTKMPMNIHGTVTFHNITSEGRDHKSCITPRGGKGTTIFIQLYCLSKTTTRLSL
jgi:hypothetical protein